MLVVEGVVSIDDSTRCRTRSTYSITITTTSCCTDTSATVVVVVVVVVVVGLIE